MPPVRDYEVENRLIEFANNSGYRYGSAWSLYAELDTAGVEVPGLGQVKCVVENANDIDGEGIYMILEVDGRLYRKNGWHASHGGTYWDGSFYACRATEKTLTDYVEA